MELSLMNFNQLLISNYELQLLFVLITNFQLRIRLILTIIFNTMKENIIQQKTYSFALEIIQLYKTLTKQNEYILSRQILKSGTSIGANIEETIGAYSTAEFLSKISISYKEARETHYWLRLLKDSGYIEESLFKKLIFDCDEIFKIIGKIQITTKANQKELKKS